MLKAVLDTVVLVRASKRAQSEAARILLAWVEGQFALIVSPAILEEYRRVLFYPRVRKGSAWSEAKVWEWLDLIERMAEVHMPGQLDLQVVRDPADDKFIVAAVEGQADYIVSGDKDLLDLGRYEEIEIISPRRFLQVLAAER